MNSIETIFEWLLAASLRASVLAVAILGIQFVLRHRLPAAWRHALWLPMLAVLVLPVLPEAPFALFPRKAAPAEIPAEMVAPVVIAAPIESTDSALPVAPAPVITAPASTTKVNFLAILWLAGACGVLLAGLIGYHRNMRRIWMTAAAPDRILQADLAEAAREAGLSRPPRTLLSPAVASPAVTGFVRPLLILPAGFPAGFSATEARLILLHEFSHLKRLDLPLNWLMCILQAMHWFNPLLWFAFARMRADREAACDAHVLSIDAADRRAEYGGALLKLQCVTPSRALNLGFVGIFERGSEIKSRIREISAHRPAHAAWRITGGSILALLMVFGVTKGQQPANNIAGQDAQGEIQPAPADPAADDRKAAIQTKLDSIIIPQIIFDDVTLEEAVDYLRMRAAELDGEENDPAKKGVNIVISIPQPAGEEAAADVKIDAIRLRNVPLGTVLRYICDQVGFQYSVGDFAVTLSPKKKGEANAAGPGNGEEKAAIQKKLDSIIIPQINFDDGTALEEAIDFLRLRAAELDGGKGINIVIRKPRPAEGEADVKMGAMRMKNVTLGMVLRMICDQAGFQHTVEDVGVILSPRN